MPKNTKYIYLENQHLTAEGVALYIDTYEKGNLSSFPDYLLNHVKSCIVCQKQIIESGSVQ